MPGCVFDVGPHIHDDEVAVIQLSGELVSADLFERGAINEGVGGQLIDVVEVRLGIIKGSLEEFVWFGSFTSLKRAWVTRRMSST